MSFTHLQNRSFHVVERTRTSTKCQKMKKGTCKECKNTVFRNLSNMQICGGFCCRRRCGCSSPLLSYKELQWFFDLQHQNTKKKNHFSTKAKLENLKGALQFTQLTDVQSDINKIKFMIYTSLIRMKIKYLYKRSHVTALVHHSLMKKLDTF